jgi:hypothetical protein
VAEGGSRADLDSEVPRNFCDPIVYGRKTSLAETAQRSTLGRFPERLESVFSTALEPMPHEEIAHLRVLIANERRDRLDSSLRSSPGSGTR